MHPTLAELLRFEALCQQREQAIRALENAYAFTLQDRINSLLDRYNADVAPIAP